MATCRMSLTAIVQTVTLSILLEICCVQSQAPLYQTVDIAAIRLSSNLATDTSRGRVDIQVTTGAWGSICPTYWNDTVTSANVNTTCAMFGFRYGGKRVNATFGEGNKNFLIENATCPANATSWSQCTQYFAKKCGPQDEELAIECNPDPNGVNFRQLLPLSPVPGSGGRAPVAPVINVTILNGVTTATCSPSNRTRLYGGDLVNASIGNGYVQVTVNNQWGFVCSDSWNQAAANVVCRELCYNVNGNGVLPGIIAKSVPEPANKNIVLNSFNCYGNEASLLDCPVVNQTAVCRSNNFIAGAQCNLNCCPGKTTVVPDVNCSSDFLVANFSKFPLITPDNIYLVNNVPRQCMNVSSTPNGVVAIISAVSTCGVYLSENSTHITYSIPIRYMWLSGSDVVNSYTNMRFDLYCSVGKAYQVINRVEPFTLAPNMTVYQQYNYTLSLDLYTNCSFTVPCTPVGSVYMLEVGQWLAAMVTINNYDNRTMSSISDCDAYPVMPYSAYTPVVKLIQDKCPVDPTLTIYSIDNRREGFQVRAFMFSGYSMVYIRCSVNVCLLGSTAPECDRACNKPQSGRRRKRQARDFRTSSVDTGTIFIYSPSDPGMAKILEAIGQKHEEYETTTTTTIGRIITSTIQPKPNQQTTTAGKQQLTTRTSSTTAKLEQHLKESSKTSVPSSTPTTSTKKISRDQEVVNSAQSAKSSESTGQPPVVTTTKSKTGEHRLETTKQTIDTAQEKVTTTKAPNTYTTKKYEQEGNQLQQQEPNKGSDGFENKNQSLANGQNGVLSALIGDDGNSANIRQLSCVASTVVFLCLFASVLL